MHNNEKFIKWMESENLKTEEAAEILSVDARTVSRWVRQGKGLDGGRSVSSGTISNAKRWSELKALQQQETEVKEKK